MQRSWWRKRVHSVTGADQGVGVGAVEAGAGHRPGDGQGVDRRRRDNLEAEVGAVGTAGAGRHPGGQDSAHPTYQEAGLGADPPHQTGSETIN